MNYFWVRVFDYDYERDNYEKGILSDEFYLRRERLTRESAKEEVENRYDGKIKKHIKFSKPRNKNGIYAIVLESDELYYNYFYKEIDTYCFHCHKQIKGKWRGFPKIKLYDGAEQYFCSCDCKNKLYQNLNFEGEFQEKEKLHEDIVGYIYHIYNRAENKHYVGQTKYLPFFRWQEHIKAKGKGNITDMSFDVITEVRYKYGEDGQELLNNAEAWWIQKYIEEGYEVFNLTVPKLSLKNYQKMFDEMVSSKRQLEII